MLLFGAIWCVISVSHSSQTMRPWSMSSMRKVVGISSSCCSCEDWCLCASEISMPSSSTHAARSGTYPDSPTTRKLADMVTHLMSSSLQPSSLPTYRRAWRLYNNFSIDGFGQSAWTLPSRPSHLAIFIAYLYKHNYASSTWNTYMSALGYILKYLFYNLFRSQENSLRVDKM